MPDPVKAEEAQCAEQEEHAYDNQHNGAYRLRPAPKWAATGRVRRNRRHRWNRLVSWRRRYRRYSWRHRGRNSWWHRACRRRSAGNRRPRPVRDAHFLSEFIQSERIGQGKPVAARFCGLVGVKYLIKDPGSNEDTKDTMLANDTNQHNKDQYMDQRLDELAVV